jgi:hypothetical protein
MEETEREMSPGAMEGARSIVAWSEIVEGMGTALGKRKGLWGGRERRKRVGARSNGKIGGYYGRLAENLGRKRRGMMGMGVRVAQGRRKEAKRELQALQGR